MSSPPLGTGVVSFGHRRDPKKSLFYRRTEQKNLIVRYAHSSFENTKEHPWRERSAGWGIPALQEYLEDEAGRVLAADYRIPPAEVPAFRAHLRQWLRDGATPQEIVDMIDILLGDIALEESTRASEHSRRSPMAAARQTPRVACPDCDGSSGGRPAVVVSQGGRSIAKPREAEGALEGSRGRKKARSGSGARVTLFDGR